MGNFGANFVGALGDGLAGSLTGGLSSLASGIAGSIFAGQAAKRQYKYQLNLMNRQAELNQQAFDYERAANNEDYEKYQSPQAQRAQIEAAGLNAGLMYSGSGTGMSSAIGSQSMNGVGAGSASLAQPSMMFDPVTASDIRLKEAQARNLDADSANKEQEFGNTAEMFPLLKLGQEALNQLRLTEIAGGELENKIKDFQVWYNEQTKWNQVTISDLQVEEARQRLSYVINEIANLQKEGRLKEANIKQVEANTQVLQQQVVVLETQAALNRAGYQLTTQQTAMVMKQAQAYAAQAREHDAKASQNELETSRAREASKYDGVNNFVAMLQNWANLGSTMATAYRDFLVGSKAGVDMVLGIMTRGVSNIGNTTTINGPSNMTPGGKVPGLYGADGKAVSWYNF